MTKPDPSKTCIGVPPALPNQASEKKCPFCVETIRVEAIKCKFCSSDLTPKTEMRCAKKLCDGLLDFRYIDGVSEFGREIGNVFVGLGWIGFLIGLVMMLNHVFLSSFSKMIVSISIPYVLALASASSMLLGYVIKISYRTSLPRWICPKCGKQYLPK